LNSRPPAYETNTKVYLKTPTKALNTANWLYFIKKIKNKTEYCTCFLLHYHQKTDKKGMIFAEFLPSKFFMFFTFKISLIYQLKIYTQYIKTNNILFSNFNLSYYYKSFLYFKAFLISCFSKKSLLIKTINLYEYLFNTKTIFIVHLVSSKKLNKCSYKLIKNIKKES